MPRNEPVTAPAGVTTVADALREAARLAALRDLLAERERELRAWLDGKARAHTAAEGTAFNHPVKGLGRVYVTEPGLRLVPTSQAAFERWALQHRPARARRQLVASAERVTAWLNEPGADPEERAARLRELVGDPEAVTEEVRVAERLLEELAEECLITEDGAVVDLETGEELPLRATPTAAPTLTIRVERAARQRLAQELRRRLGLLGLPAPGAEPPAAQAAEY